MTTDLKEMRERSGMSQSEVARRMGVAQSQISRWEQKPDDIPFGMLQQYLGVIGQAQVSLSTATLTASGLDVGDPYHDLRQQVNLLISYLEHAPQFPDALDSTFTPSSFRDEIRRASRKPLVMLAGRFDAGKSRIANTLLGKSVLPERYQPYTYIPMYVRHIGDRPSWIPDSVVILDANFDPLFWDDEEHIRMHRVTDGNFRTLQEWGVHGRVVDEYIAMAFVDAPILKGCNLLDTPGFEHSLRDLQATDRVARGVDLLVYASAIQGCYGGADIARLPSLIRMLPEPEIDDPSFPTLGNLVLLATHAHPAVPDDQIPIVVKESAHRLYRELGGTVFDERSRRTKRPIDAEVLAGRICSFWAESPKRRERFEELLSTVLSRDLPRIIQRRTSKRIAAFNDGSRSSISDLIATCQSTLDNLDQVRATLNAMRENEEAFKKQIDTKQSEIWRWIEDEEKCNVGEVRHLYDRTIHEELIEKLIRDNYSSKKEAADLVVPRLIEMLNAGTRRVLEDAGERFAHRVEDFLDEYDRAYSFSGVRGPGETPYIPFDAKTAFAGGLTAGVGIGALAFWAASLGNLGSYILVAKGVSLLAAMGIGVGGGAAASTAVAAIGGPIVIALGLGILIALGVYYIFGPSWQVRLARKVVELFEKEGIKTQFCSAVSNFWKETRSAFDKAVENVEAERAKKRTDLEKLLEDEDLTVQKYNSLMVIARRLRDFFENMPWRFEP